jgi:hypothetical protein
MTIKTIVSAMMAGLLADKISCTVYGCVVDPISYSARTGR